MSRRQIAVKAMCLFEHEGRVLLTRGYDSVKDEHFYRVPGGHVEFGERAEEAVRREIIEELNSEIEDLVFERVVENIFQYQGAPGHEIVFIYTGRLGNQALYEKDVISYLEHDGSHHEAVWVPLADVLSGAARTYPACDYRAILSDRVRAGMS